jgi:protease I
MRIIQLPTPESSGSMSFEQALVHMTTVQALGTESLPLPQIGQLAWAALDGQGTVMPLPVQVSGDQRNSASDDGDQPLMLMFVMHDGVYRYQPRGHLLEQVSSKDMRIPLAASVFGRVSAPIGGCGIVLAGSVQERSGRSKLSMRRQQYLMAGRIVQNIRLQAACYGLVTLTGEAFDTASIKKGCALSRNHDVLEVLFVGRGTTGAAARPSEDQRVVTPPAPRQKQPQKVVLITPSQNFRDEELFETARVLNEFGIQTVIASTQVGTLTGMLGGMAQASIVIEQINIDEFGALVFIGGSGAQTLFDYPAAWQLARVAVQKKKVLGAICLAPVILARAGVLKDIPATCYPTYANDLVQAGATYTGNPVERHEHIITAKGPATATAFGRAIVEALMK